MHRLPREGMIGWVWNPETYLTFADHRGRPFYDLLSRVAANAPRRVVDLGCGPGNLTETLLQRWPGATLEAWDSSPEMVAAAQAPRASPRARRATSSASQSIWGYDNMATVRWTNLNTRRSGTLRATLRANGATGGATKYFFNVYTGSGKVRIELQPTNRGALLTLGASTCSDVFTVR